jgi:AAHS family 4-hydroxybenzoate transporter-like MFS transporter
VTVPPGAEFFLGDEAHLAAKSSMFILAPLFKGRLAWMTPLLWMCYVASSGTVFFMSFWGPTLVEALDVRPGPAAIAASLFSIGGLIAAVTVARFIDRLGAIVIAIMPLIASPLIAMLGTVRLSGDMYMPAMFVVGFFTVGGHASLHSIAGIFYPSACRSNGTGWALSVSRLGTIGGPYLGGILLSAHMPLRQIFIIAALPSLVFAVGIFCLGLIHRRILRDEAAFRQTSETPDAVGSAAADSLRAYRL